ncbi:MAG: hypothetical protein ACM3UZ_12555 [Acidobacteriota bacterium]
MNDKYVIVNTESKAMTIEHLYTVDDYLTFSISVRSGVFAGEAHFCIPKQAIVLIVETLSDIYKIRGKM